MSAKRSKVEDPEKVKFEQLHAELVTEIIDGIKHEYPDFSEAGLVHIKKVFEYNCMGGKMNRGLSVLNALTHLKKRKGETVTAEDARKANILGWCVEWMQAFFLIEDDIMDGSITRRSAPCWYKVEGIGMIAINDGCILEKAIYKLLKKNFKGESYYVHLLEIMNETTWQTELGQCLDLITAPEDHVDLNKFNLAKYQCIVKYKTAFYSFYLPIALAFYMVGINDEKAHKGAEIILLELGEFFQIQDDYLDCYGTYEQIGKHGTDIQDNKCGWLINKALTLGLTAEQRAILDNNYGKKDDASVERVKALYRSLNLEQLYKEEEQRSVKDFQNLINKHRDDRIPDEVYTDFSKKIYGRTK